ncbi:hypothetical protein M0R45_015273 [Rubus argutus]|uniref:Uncharacterized protein n=1 Tax=Rubus argutus TaxID=59490 RepID=A0AAW1XP71_RUBAR
MIVKGIGYNNKHHSLCRIVVFVSEFAFVLLSRASNLHLVEGKLYLLLLGTTSLGLVTTPFLFTLIPGLVHLGVLLRWFSPDGAVEIGFKGDNLHTDSGKQRVILLVRESHNSRSMYKGNCVGDLKLTQHLLIQPRLGVVLVASIRSYYFLYFSYNSILE